MDLARALNTPATVSIGGRLLQFSEFTLTELAILQQWIKDHVPHPIESIRDHLAKVSGEDRATLLDQARRESRVWPPVPGTRPFSDALFNSPDGMLFALDLALRKHQPKSNARAAKWLSSAMERDEATTRKIVSILFGKDQNDDDESDLDDILPKDPGATTTSRSPASTTTS